MNIFGPQVCLTAGCPKAIFGGPFEGDVIGGKRPGAEVAVGSLAGGPKPAVETDCGPSGSIPGLGT